MIKIIKNISAIAIIAVVIASCGGKKTDSLSVKKAQLDSLKKEQNSIADKIKTLESEIAKLDTSAKEDVAKLVNTITLSTQNFTHYIDLQGRVDADNISYITPRYGPGQVKAIYVKKGDFVKKGQLLLQLDDAVVKQNYIAAKKNIETLKTQLAFQQDLLNRRNNLWKQGIGTELDVLQAKTTVESLQKQIDAGEASAKTVQEQLNASNIYADVDGIADEVNVKVGETFVGMMGATAQIVIVNTNTLKAVIDVPENYSDKVKMGSKAVVVLPDVNKTDTTHISFVSKSINVLTRSFTAEAKLPYDGIIRPNQVAQVRIQDYTAKATIIVPVNTVGTDDKGKYVYVAVKQGEKLVAVKKMIEIGLSYGDLVEVKKGLNAGDQLITDGYQNIYDGQSLKLDTK